MDAIAMSGGDAHLLAPFDGSCQRAFVASLAALHRTSTSSAAIPLGLLGFRTIGSMRRALLCQGAIAWSAVFLLDFFMTSGVDIIDGSIQTSLLRLADFCAGIAACAVPIGSFTGAGVVLKATGIAAASPGVGQLAALAGSACFVLIFAREIVWCPAVFNPHFLMVLSITANTVFMPWKAGFMIRVH